MWREEGFLHLSHRYQELIVWQKSKELAGVIYRATERFPKSELYGLTAQLRRVSVPSNIAEGQGRLTTGEFRRFLGQSRGSLLELETQLAIAADLGYISQAELGTIQLRTTDIRPLLSGLIESLGNAKPIQNTSSARNLKLETGNLKTRA